jgi:hypothetical protein
VGHQREEAEEDELRRHIGPEVTRPLRQGDGLGALPHELSGKRLLALLDPVELGTPQELDEPRVGAEELEIGAKGIGKIKPPGPPSLSPVDSPIRPPSSCLLA